MNIVELLGLNGVKPYTNNKARPLPCPDPTLLYGLELEIEGLPNDPTSLYVSGMSGTADNSLRETDQGRGWEFITKPATFSVAGLILENFFNKAKLTQERNYSERCSVHVHVNVQDFQATQLKTLCLLYQVFEKVFYSYAGEERDMNIFCVPWSETALTYSLIDRLTDKGLPNLRGWQKYTGLNLLPVLTQGTVEFRHLPGTCDLNKILNWMRLIGSLTAVSRSKSYDEVKDAVMSVNTSSDYRGLSNMVFGDNLALIPKQDLAELIEEGSMHVKFMLMSSTDQNQKTKKEAVEAHNFFFENQVPDRAAGNAAAERVRELLRRDLDQRQGWAQQINQIAPRINEIRPAPRRNAIINDIQPQEGQAF